MIFPHLPKLALSIRQPWAWLIITGYKPLENRAWKPRNPGLKYRGEFAVHAGVKVEQDCAEDIFHGLHPVTGERYDFPVEEYKTGGIVGVAEIVDVVTFHDNDYFVGPYGLVIENPRPIDLIPVKGALGFFDWRKQWEKENG